MCGLRPDAFIVSRCESEGETFYCIKKQSPIDTIQIRTRDKLLPYIFFVFVYLYVLGHMTVTCLSHS